MKATLARPAAAERPTSRQPRKTPEMHSPSRSALPIDGSDWNSFFIVAGKPVPSRSELPGNGGLLEVNAIEIGRGILLFA